MVVVAIGLVSDARSNRVAGLTTRFVGAVKSPGYAKCPKALQATSRPLWVTATEALGKARWTIASCRTAKAEANCSSWRSNADCRDGASAGGMGQVINSSSHHRA